MALEKSKKEAEEAKKSYENKIKEIEKKTKEKNDEVFNRMKDYINNELGKTSKCYQFRFG